MNCQRLLILSVFALSLSGSWAAGAERVRLNENNWEEYAPAGKEVDCIYGDYVMRNDKIVVVIANPVASRNANMTVRNVGGTVIDITSRTEMNDQLSAFYPGAGLARFTKLRDEAESKPESADSVSLTVVSEASATKPTQTVTYSLKDGDSFLNVKTTFANPNDEPITFELSDSVRADRSFAMGIEESLNLFWCDDIWWRQSYGITSQDHRVKPVDDSLEKRRPFIWYERLGNTRVTLEANAKYELSRKLIPASNELQLYGIARSIAGVAQGRVDIEVKDRDGPVDLALVEVLVNGKSKGQARTGESGRLSFLVDGSGRVEVATKSAGRNATQQWDWTDSPNYGITAKLTRPSYVAATVTDETGKPIPCKVEFRGRDGTENPDFGPDTFVHAVKNLRYTENGKFRQRISPGKYDVIISRGNEYDAVFTQIEVPRQETAILRAQLKRSVDTPGWVSTEYHSHSTPSGDNTSDQAGRVLNLICEHLEFCPCTEHNRISTYVPHLKRFGAEHLMATCSGMELTGSPLPVNHQNAFPLEYKPRSQDGGGPTTDENPIVQIERLALWDNNSEKLVQSNHPNLVQILGDRNLDGSPDGGFEAMFGFMDVVEVHPPAWIFDDPTENDGKSRGNVIFNWMQMLNLGYRIPGVVNTDAHYNFHGSGWLRNYVKSSTDDPAKISVDEMVKHSEAGHIIMTNGPYLEVSLAADGNTAIPGEDIVAKDGATLKVTVKCANWLNVNRVQVFVNGRPDERLNFTRVSHPQMFMTGVVKFQQEIPLKLESDAHIIVATAGEGLQLGPVVGPDRARDMPVAVSNPIFVDVDGDGFTPNKELLGVPLPIKE